MDSNTIDLEDKQELGELLGLLQEVLFDKKVAGRTLELVRKRRDRKMIEVAVPQMPPYAAPDDPEDLLGFEFGLELAFRPTRSPARLSPAELVPLLFVPPKKDEKRGRYANSALYMMFHDAASNFAAQIGAKHGSQNMSTCSDTEIEFPSPIMTKLSQIEWYYSLIRAVADGIGAKLDNEKTNSGGGHLHVSPIKREWTDWEKFAVIMAMCESPWLGWVFNDPEDDETAICPSILITRSLVRHNSGGNHWWENVDFEGESVAVRPNSQTVTTLEFRCFQASIDWEEQRLHILFLDRWLKHVLKDPKKTVPKQMPPMSFMFPQDLAAITFARAQKAFNQLLEEINLDPAEYSRFVERNMKKRYDNGWVRN